MGEASPSLPSSRPSPAAQARALPLFCVDVPALPPALLDELEGLEDPFAWPQGTHILYDHLLELHRRRRAALQAELERIEEWLQEEKDR